MHARLHDRRFVTTANPEGHADASTVFHYFVHDTTITGSYTGGKIRSGQVVGRVTGPDTIELLYHCLTQDNELLAGWSRGVVDVDDAGRTILAFEWGWLSGASGGGESHYIELTDA